MKNYPNLQPRWIAAFYVATGLLLPAALCPCAEAQKPSPEVKLLSAMNDSLLRTALYSVPNRLVSQVAASGAVSVNAAWERGEGTQWFIEQQRYCADLVQAGVARKDDDLIKQGLRIMDWGFKHQGEDGSFPGTGDPFHSTSFFVEAAARSLLLLKQYDSAKYAETIQINAPKVTTAALWLTHPEVEGRGKKNNAPYTHRRWILAAALGQAGALTNNSLLKEKAAEYAREGLSLQREDGVNPEKEGADVSYQAVGLLFAGRYYLTCEDTDLKARVRQDIRHGLEWESTKIGNDGTVDVEGSTRTAIEQGRTGKTKHVDFKNLVQSLVLGAAITGEPSFHSKAQRVAQGRGW